MSLRKREISKWLELNGNEKQHNGNLWDATKVALRWKFIALNTILEKKSEFKYMISA